MATNASELLGLDAFQLSEVLTQRSIILRGEEICSPLTIEQVSTHTYMYTHIYSPHLDRSLPPTHSHARSNTPSGFLLIVTGRGFPGLCCHGVIFPVFLLDHPQDQSEDQREGKLQIHRHPRHLWL